MKPSKLRVAQRTGGSCVDTVSQSVCLAGVPASQRRRDQSGRVAGRVKLDLVPVLAQHHPNRLGLQSHTVGELAFGSAETIEDERHRSTICKNVRLRLGRTLEVVRESVTQILHVVLMDVAESMLAEIEGARPPVAGAVVSVIEPRDLGFPTLELNFHRRLQQSFVQCRGRIVVVGCVESETRNSGSRSDKRRQLWNSDGSQRRCGRRGGQTVSTGKRNSCRRDLQV